MNQFHWKGSSGQNAASNATGKSTAALSTSTADLPGIKIQPNQSYKAQVVTVNPPSNTTNNSRATATNTSQSTKGGQIQISVPQANGQIVTVSQPVAQLPQGINTNQQFQVLLNIGKNGELTVTLSTDKQAASAATTSATGNTAQTVKLSLSSNQIVELLTLNKAFKNVGTSQTPTVQTTAQITTPKGPNQLPQLKLPGSNSTIKLPDNIASLLKGQKSVSVTLKAQGQDINIQINLNKGSNKNALTATITTEKLSPTIKQALNQTSNQQIQINKQGNTDKIVLSNQQTLNLGGKIPTLTQGQGQIKLPQLSAGQLNIQISTNEKPSTSSKITIPAEQVSNSIKQALVASAQTNTQQSAKNLSATQTIENGKIVTTTQQQAIDQTTSKNAAQTTTKTEQIQSIQDPQAPQIQAAKPAPDLQIQKQALQQFIDPLVRLLLPKKQSWSEGFKTLAALEQSIKPEGKIDVKATPNQTQTLTQNSNNNQTNIDLKQLINQVKQAIPDHTSNLDDKTITTMVTEILNFSPTKPATPSVQPTPANAIASALQLLLGAKLTQGEAKLSNQLQQQLQQLIKPMAPKAPASEAGVKSAMQGLNNLDQATGSLKALTGIQSSMRHQQVENVEKRLDGNNQLEFSFPLRVDNQVKELHIAINEEKHKSETSSARLSIWNLNLTFDLNDFGKLLVNAKLKDGEVSMHMYAEQPKTLALMNKFSATLEERLEFHGVKINNIQSSLGKISSSNSKRQLNSLVQIKV